MTTTIGITNAVRAYSTLIDSLDLRSKITLLTGATSFTLTPWDSIGLGEVRLSDGPDGGTGTEVHRWPYGRTAAERDAAGIGVERRHRPRGRPVTGGRGAGTRDPRRSRTRPSTCTGPCSAAGCSRRTPKTRCSPASSPRAYVKGLQDSGVGACLKHLVANESETDRNTMNSVMDEATLRELYLLPFEIAVSRGGPVVDHGCV